MRKLILLAVVLIAGIVIYVAERASEFFGSIPWAVGYFNRRYL